MALLNTWENTIGHIVKRYESTEYCFETRIAGADVEVGQAVTEAVAGTVEIPVDGTLALSGIVCTAGLEGEQVVVLVRGSAIVTDSITLGGTLDIAEASTDLLALDILVRADGAPYAFGR